MAEELKEVREKVERMCTVASQKSERRLTSVSASPTPSIRVGRRASEVRAMNWIVEVRLIKPDGEVADSHIWRKALDQLAANALYQKLVAELKEEYPNTQP